MHLLVEFALIARIRERFDGVEETSEKETYTFGNTTFDYTNNELRTSASKTLITSRQAEILSLLVKHLNTAVSRDAILEQVWGMVSYTNALALNVQISYLRKALKNDAKVSLVSLSIKGYVLRG